MGGNAATAGPKFCQNFTLTQSERSLDELRTASEQPLHGLLYEIPPKFHKPLLGSYSRLVVGSLLGPPNNPLVFGVSDQPRVL